MSRMVIDLDDDLVKKARELTGLKKKVDIVNKALEEFVQLPVEHIRWLIEFRKRRKNYSERELR